MIIGIVCVNNDWAIGKNNGLLYNLKADMDNFRTITTNFGDGAFVCMGENTLRSLPGGKALKKRVNIVLCREGHEYEDCICIHTFDEFIKNIKLISKQFDVYVIGGGMLYKSMLPYYDKIIVTKVDHSDPEATVFFPNIDLDENFKCTFTSKAQEEKGYKFTFNSYYRVSKEPVNE